MSNTSKTKANKEVQVDEVFISNEGIKKIQEFAEAVQKAVNVGIVDYEKAYNTLIAVVGSVVTKK